MKLKRKGERDGNYKERREEEGRKEDGGRERGKERR